MKIKINSDVHDIVDRIKEIDDGYYIVFDTIKNKFELHNSNQPVTYCLTIPYDVLDARVLDVIYSTSVQNIDNILEEIDNSNDVIERNTIKEMKDASDYKLREIYKFANNSSKEIGCDCAFENVWR